jgi:hypothetical protein
MRLRIAPNPARLAIYAALAAIVLAPVLSVRVPGLGDYLNHLARMHVLASIDTSPALQRFYRVQWSPIPYLAMDAVVPPLARVLPLYLAGKLFVCACVLAPAAGAASLHYALHRRLSLVPAAGFLVSYNMLLSLGFLNFLFSTGCAVMLFAAWVATAGWPRWPRAALFAPAVLLLYFGHVFAWLGYGLAVFGFEAGRAVRARFRPVPSVAADAAAALLSAAPALGFAATLDVGAGYVGRLTNDYGGVGAKLMAAASPLLFAHDEANFAVLLGALVLGVWLLARLRVHPAIWPSVLSVALAAVCVPHVMDSTWGTDLRLPLVALLLLIGGVSARHGAPARGGVWRPAATAALLILVAAKSADAARLLAGLDRLIAETRRVVAVLPPGARLLVVNDLGGNTGREEVSASTYWHMPLTAVIDRDAFVPTLFSGLSTVHIQPAYRLASTPNGLPVTPAQLWQGFRHEEEAGRDIGNGLGARLYHFGWPAKFDFVLVQRFGRDPGPLPPNLDLLVHEADMDLYRILR